MQQVPRGPERRGTAAAQAPAAAAFQTRQITRELLAEMQVLCQWDRKFIVAHVQGLVCLFDQHAVSERVHLEALQAHWMLEEHGTYPPVCCIWVCCSHFLAPILIYDGDQRTCSCLVWSALARGCI